MTVERYERLLAYQNFKCAIPSCTVKNRRLLDVDHNHDTGEVRGLLCRNCNIMAGRCHESTAVLADLITYLHSDTPVLL